MSTPEGWTAFGAAPEGDSSWAVLHDGVPVWMKAAVINWILWEVSLPHGDFIDGPSLATLQNATQLSLGASEAPLIYPSSVSNTLRGLPDRSLLRLVDYLLVRSTNQEQMRGILADAQSKWAVGTRSAGALGLVERVPSGVQDAAEAVGDRAGVAGQLLREAWAYLHQLTPSPSDAFSRAVRAVEVVVIDKVTPDNPEATLGSVMRKMRTDGDWRLPLREHDQAPSSQLILDMLQTLWRGHRDRHGSRDYSHVTVDEARAAVDLAVSLVDWFWSDLVQRRERVKDEVSARDDL